VAPDSAFDEIIENARSLVTKTLKLAIDDSVSPRMDLNKDTQAIAKLMFSNQRIEKMEERECEVLMPKEENPQWKRVQKKERFGLDKDGKPVSKNRVYQLRDGLFEAIIDKFYTDPTLVAYGEEKQRLGRRFCCLPWLNRIITLSTFVQLTHIRRCNCWFSRWLRTLWRSSYNRTYVRRLFGSCRR
jgi:2-oxoisovalerate dehydrogenase E1 component